MSPTRKRPTDLQLTLAVKAGHLDAQTRTGRTAGPRTCTTCRRRTLVGDDSHLAALTATVDPTPLTLHQEALHLAAGRRLYAARGWPHHPQLLHLDRWRVVGMLAPSDDPLAYRTEYVILPEHECNALARMRRARRKAPRKKRPGTSGK